MNSKDIRQKELEYAQSLSASMLAWEESQKRKLAEILKRKGIILTKDNIPTIVHATTFEQICSPENSTYCPLYLKQERCHPQLLELNCFLCNCPNYDAKYIEEQEENTLVGKCTIQSKGGHYHFSSLYTQSSS